VRKKAWNLCPKIISFVQSLMKLHPNHCAPARDWSMVRFSLRHSKHAKPRSCKTFHKQHILMSSAVLTYVNMRAHRHCSVISDNRRMKRLSHVSQSRGFSSQIPSPLLNTQYVSDEEQFVSRRTSQTFFFLNAEQTFGKHVDLATIFTYLNIYNLTSHISSSERI
jgi:hypothetical protein